MSKEKIIISIIITILVAGAVGIFFYQNKLKKTDMEKIHTQQKEPITFLTLAAEAMKEYKNKNGHYAANWNELNFSYSGKPYHIGDPDTKPDANIGNSWKPPYCEYTYVIESSSDDAFLVSAVNTDNKVEYGINQEMNFPSAI